MTPFETLSLSTQTERAFLQGAPAIQLALKGDVTRELYLAFLEQAWHHVRHTVPLLFSVGSRLSPRHAWLQGELAHYLEEEQGHDEWILSDIAASGGDAQRVRASRPAYETDAMVAYAYDTVMRRNPVGFFGMVFVLEGTSAALALNAATSIQRALGLPDRSFSYLRSHGILDREHVGNLESIVNRLDEQLDLPDVIACARAMYRLYGGVFRSLDINAGRQERPLVAGTGVEMEVACN